MVYSAAVFLKMSYNIKIVKTEKRKNSTKAAASAGLSKSVVLKNETDILNPTFIISGESFETISKYNQLVAFGRTYWIEKVKSKNNNINEIECSIDPLATYRSDILDLETYVKRCSDSKHWNMEYQDTECLPTNILKGNFTTNSDSTGFDYDNYVGNGNSLVTIYGKNGVDTIISRMEPSSIIEALLDTNDVWDAIKINLCDPNKYITDCFKIPFTPNGIVYDGVEVTIGNLERSFGNASLVRELGSGYIYRKVVSIPCESINIGDGYTDFRRYDDLFTRIKLYVPFVGTIEISATYLRYEHIRAEYVIDVLTGRGDCLIHATSSSSSRPDMLIGKYSVDLAVKVLVGTSYLRSPIVNVLQNPLKPSSIIDVAVNPKGGMDIIGSAGAFGIYQIDHMIAYIEQYESISRSYYHEKGHPTYDRLTLGKLKTGTYVECLEPSIEISGALPEEINMINDSLKSGVYLD